MNNCANISISSKLISPKTLRVIAEIEWDKDVDPTTQAWLRDAIEAALEEWEATI
jgi:hypothetical protein